ncbi:kinesin-like protein [Achlya hypogyna]|uniref:Kinesin-like protein n=1 Tax=Achlya hypogyna TaxID=1202772 RepID=A0A1V9ZUA1_ACHHY|nr:kinesin-like protein [Achlya hypogyna]
MGKNGVKVIIRARPTAVFAQNQIHIDQDDNTIEIDVSDAKAETGPSNKKESWKFKFHQVLQNAGQDKVYEAIARDIVHGAIVDGINGTIMAYGQTGAGKTFTMIGDTRNYQHRGIAPRAIAQVYQEIESRIEIESTIHVSYMEIYNDRIFDLLAPDDADLDMVDYVVVEDARGTYVRGLTQVEASTEKDALDQLFKGELQRTVAEHQLNKRSNRSHCIFTFHISQKSRTGGNEHVVHSKLHLVDLAGSERLKKTMNDDDSKAHKSTIKKESMYINQSLTFLEQCIVALGAREQRHIPYRQTKLTNVLKDSLGGNCNTLMFACIWGESKHIEETISTLKLAQRMMRVQNEATSIVETDPSILIKKYERQIKELKQELTMHDALVERTGVVYDEHTPEQKFELMRLVRAYTDAPTDDDFSLLQLSSLRHIKELFRQFRLLLRNAESASPQALATRTSTSNASRDSGSPATTLDDDEKLVGDPEEHGFVLGVAPNGAMPVSLEIAKKDPGMRLDDTGGVLRDASPVDLQSDEKTGNNDAKGGDYDEAFGKNEAYKFYITNGPGKKTHVQLQEEKETLKQTKEKMKDITAQLNSTKAAIDDLKLQVGEKRTNRKSPKKEGKATSDGDEVVDEEEFILMQKEREAKRDYRVLFEDLKEARAEYEFTQRSIELLRMRVVSEFEEWYREGGSQAKNGETDNDQDKLDEGEKFDQMEVDRIRAQDPDSLAFFQAQKKMRQATSTNSNQRKTKR